MTEAQRAAICRGDRWRVIQRGDVRHVMPIGEKHALADCWCEPTLDGGVVVHRSRDRREDREEH